MNETAALLVRVDNAYELGQRVAGYAVGGIALFGSVFLMDRSWWLEGAAIVLAVYCWYQSVRAQKLFNGLKTAIVASGSTQTL